MMPPMLSRVLVVVLFAKYHLWAAPRPPLTPPPNRFDVRGLAPTFDGNERMSDFLPS